MIECVISLFFLQVEAGVGVLTSCLLYFSAERIGRFDHVRPSFGDFCTIIAGEVLSVTQPLLPSFGSGGTEA